MEDPNIKDIFNKIKDILAKKRDTDAKLKFNIFSSISDVFYKENFHSDILFMFLQNEVIHNSLFDYYDIRDVEKNSVKIFKEYFSTYAGTKNGRIDILIKYQINNNPHCIILENKINNAVDQERQLYRYYDHCLNNDKMEVDKIIYLNLAGEKEPDLDVWEKDKINDKLAKIDATEFINAITRNNEDLDVNTWSALIQYKNLITYLKGDTTMKANQKLYELIKEKKENYDILKEFVDVFNEFPSFIAKDVFEKAEKYFSDNEKDFKSFKKPICFTSGFAFDTNQIKDNRTKYKDIKYAFRVLFAFYRDHYDVKFYYFGYRTSDDNALNEKTEKDPTLLNNVKEICKNKGLSLTKDDKNFFTIFNTSQYCDIKQADFVEGIKNNFNWDVLKGIDEVVSDYIKDVEK